MFAKYNRATSYCDSLLSLEFNQLLCWLIENENDDGDNSDIIDNCVAQFMIVAWCVSVLCEYWIMI